MTKEIDYSDPNEGMSSPDLMTSALGNMELIRDTHWSDKDRIGVPLDDDDPDEPGGADRLGATRCAITAVEILIARENSRPASAVTGPITGERDHRDIHEDLDDKLRNVYTVANLLSAADPDEVDIGQVNAAGHLLTRMVTEARTLSEEHFRLWQGGAK